MLLKGLLAHLRTGSECIVEAGLVLNVFCYIQRATWLIVKGYNPIEDNLFAYLARLRRYQVLILQED